MLRWLTAGESHGPALVAIIEGLPAGVRTSTKAVSDALARRRLGHGRGARMKFEQDEVAFLGGVRHGLTQGGPVAIRIGNSEWPKWQTAMSADPIAGPASLDELEPGSAEFSATGAGQARSAPLTRPRPGHADLVGMQKYGFDDARPVLERASARETAARVALGDVARAFLDQAAGIRVLSHVVRLGPVVTVEGLLPRPGDLERIDADPVRCFDPEASSAMVAEIDACHKAGDTLGGVVEVLAYNLPPGLGSHVHWDRRLDARLAAALMSIQAIKGVELGDGFGLAAIRGSLAHDEMEPGRPGVRRRSGHSGGTEGGMSTGGPLRVRAAMKPIATIPRALATIDTASGEAAVAHHQRSDVCAVPAAGVVAEAMVALVLAEALLEKFGGDSVSETARNLAGYLAEVRTRGLEVLR
ncbi:chorismate synthase [Actinocrinis puniceicyclus]|uniref:Chorismate synthase n=1 Tax=Actinocrinis puniceicyclus TaxID=977794 RepID=A0A8J8BB69_9ACTN|nr:chorismate synthase [Actinocrinis puniceicyclus]MBS2963712.1 chorismate synthase [Actinocrinis puniceicyclus]